jgi:hypothetical protein
MAVVWASMRLPARASLGVASLLAAACTESTEPAVTITTVTPASAYNDNNVDVQIEGGPFRPEYDIDTTAGTAVPQLGAFTAFLTRHAPRLDQVAVDALMWISPSQIEAVLPLGIAAGSYDVVVRDPRGSLARLPGAFTSLGPDETPPQISIIEPGPGTIVNAQAEVPVAFEADDGAGQLAVLTWTVSLDGVQTLQGTCPLEPNAQKTTCRFNFVVPEPRVTPESLTVDVTATDTASNVGTAQTTLAVGLAPTVQDVSPTIGPASGGTAVTIAGDDFITGTQVFIGDALLEPNGGEVVDAHTIHGTTTVHEPGSYAVTVQTGAEAVKAKDAFVFVGQPQVLIVSPTSGPTAGGAPLTIVGRNFRDQHQTQFSMGATIGDSATLDCTFVSSNRCECTTMPGSGAVTIFAQDAVSGVGQLLLGYTYLDGQGDAGAPDEAPDEESDEAPDDGAPPLHQVTPPPDAADAPTGDDAVFDAIAVDAAVDAGAPSADAPGPDDGGVE